MGYGLSFDDRDIAYTWRLDGHVVNLRVQMAPLYSVELRPSYQLATDPAPLLPSYL